MRKGGWQKVDVPFVTRLVSFRAKARTGEILDLPADPKQPIFIRTRDGDLWSADNFLGFFFQKKGTKLQNYVPLSLLVTDRAVVEFPININPPGTFHVMTNNGAMDVKMVVSFVEFRRSDAVTICPPTIIGMNTPSDLKATVEAHQFASDEHPPPPIDPNLLKEMIIAYDRLVAKLLNIEKSNAEKIIGNPLADNVRRMMAVHSSRAMIVPEFAQKNLKEIIEMAPTVALALLRFGFEVKCVEPIIDRLLAEPSNRRFIHSRLRKADQIEPVMSELYYLGWLNSKNLAPVFIEQEGRPDGLMQFNENQLYFEIKTIGNLERNVRKLISDANKQVKNAGDDANGICVIRYSNVVNIREHEREILFSRVMRQIARSMLSRSNKSVAAVIFQWDEVNYDIHGSDLWLFASKGSRLYTHYRARQPLVGNLQDLCPAATAVCRIILRPA